MTRARIKLAAQLTPKRVTIRVDQKMPERLSPFSRGLLVPHGISIEKVTAWRGYSVEWHDGSSVILARRNRLYSVEKIGGNPTFIGEVPFSPVERTLSFTRLGQRFLRTMFYNVLPLGNGRWFATFARRIGVLSPDGWTEVRLPRPSRVLRGGAAIAPDGSIWFGEYWDNAKRRSMSLYRWERGSASAEVAYEFDRGSIYHIHSVSWDPYRNSLICLTGDRDGECRMLISPDGFRTVDVIGAGSEDWRAVSIVSVPDGWLYGTDAEFQTNVIAHVEAASGSRRVLDRVDGPVYYSRAWGAGALFAVTAERCAIVPEPQAVLLRIAQDSVRPLARFKKDINDSILAWKLFLPGTLNFASGPGAVGHCFVSGVALRDLDEQVLVLRPS